MKLLICTQKVDKNDPVLGFFHRWIEEFAKHAEHVHVISLGVGEYDLPENVSVHSLGKEEGTGNKFSYALKFIRLIFLLRKEYNSVFVHMNPEYVVLGGLFWRAFKKKVVLWYNHPAKSIRLKIALMLAHRVCFTSPSAVSSMSKKATQMPVGVDADMFTPAPHSAERDILVVGRISPYKRVHHMIEALDILEDKRIALTASMYGDTLARDALYAKAIKERIENSNLSEYISLHEGVPHEELPQIFRKHRVYLNLSEEGNFDKTIIEAMSAGLLVVTANHAVFAALPKELQAEYENPKSAAQALGYALSLSRDEVGKIAQKLRAYVVKNHSLSSLTKKLFNEILL